LGINGENCWNGMKKGSILEEIIKNRGGFNELASIINYDSNNCRISIRGGRLKSELFISKSLEEFSSRVGSLELSYILEKFKNLFINEIKLELRNFISKKIKTDNKIIMENIDKKIEMLKEELLEKFSIYIAYKNEISGIKNYAFLGGGRNIKNSINDIKRYVEDNLEMKEIYLKSILKIKDIIKIPFRDSKKTGTDKKINEIEYLGEISYFKLK